MNENDYFYDVEDPNNRPAGNKAAQPEGYMNMGLFTFLLIITLGLYGIYLYYKFTKVTNEDRMLPQRTPWAQLLCCIFIPFYRWYWFYMASLRMDNLVRLKARQQSNTMLTNLLLSLFGLDQIAFIVLQNSYNKTVGGATGKSPNSTGYGRCKKCGQEFPDDYAYCPYCNTPYKKPFYRKLWFNITAVVALILAAIILLVIFTPSSSSDGAGDGEQALEPSYGYSVPNDGSDGSGSAGAGGSQAGGSGAGAQGGVQGSDGQGGYYIVDPSDGSAYYVPGPGAGSGSGAGSGARGGSGSAGSQGGARSGSQGGLGSGAQGGATQSL